MAIYFFNASSNAHDQLTKLFDFVWPTAAAMWNLRWQVAGYLGVVPSATNSELQSRFTNGSGIDRADLRISCIDSTWDDQLETFARIVLTNNIAVYEAWLEDVLSLLGKNTKTTRTNLQFPTGNGSPATGVSAGIARVTAIESPIIKDSFYDPMRGCRNYDLARIEGLLKCYRFFKELRNCDVHSGGVAGQRLVDAYATYAPVATLPALGVKEVPEYFPPVLGDKIRISLRGVAGFAEVILKILATLDAEFSRAHGAETEFINKWKRTYRDKKNLPRDAGKRNATIERFVKNSGFPKPLKAKELGDWLTNKGLTNF